MAQHQRFRLEHTLRTLEGAEAVSSVAGAGGNGVAQAAIAVQCTVVFASSSVSYGRECTVLVASKLL